MFRWTTTFLVIVLILNHDFAAARSFEPFYRSDNRETFTEMDPDDPSDPSTELLEISQNETHSRRKRNWGALIRGGLSALAIGSFGLSIGGQIYGAIRDCNDFTPVPCKYPECNYLVSCPDVCHGPDTNREYILREKDNIRRMLDALDKQQLNAFNLATDSIRAGLLNQRILTEIDRINQKVDQMMFDLVDMDITIAERFKNQSVAIKSVLRNERLTLEDVVASPEVQGIFDKWTWEGTGTFVLSLALPVGLQLFSKLRERYAIRQLYNEMKVDFSNRFINQKATTNPNRLNQPKIRNKFAYVQGYSTKKIDAQIKQAAKARFYSDKSLKKATKLQKFTNNYLAPVLNVVISALSVWQTYEFITGCIGVANDMQDTAITITNQKNRIEEMKQTQIDVLEYNITTQAWDPVKNLLTNETFSDWLDGIRNLTLGANNKNVAAANTIQNFIDTIDGAGVDSTIAKQNALATALAGVEFEFACLADKTHATAIVLKDCRLGKESFTQLYADADSKYKLNRKACVDKKMVPYTSIEEFEFIINKTSEKQGWYANCLLNDNDLLIRVCGEYLKGYTRPGEIVARINKTTVDEAMVENFLTRCPPPEITPKSRIDACKLYCLYDKPKDIAKSGGLLESQVHEIIKSCSICKVRADQLSKICTARFCKGDSATVIEPTVRLPLPTVQYVIANTCEQKCVVTGEQETEICQQSKCKDFAASKIAKSLGLPLSTINEVTAKCDTILPSCGPISDVDKGRIIDLYCSWGASAKFIKKFVDVPLASIQAVIDEVKAGVEKCPVEEE